MIRNIGNEPTMIYYLDTPPTRDELITDMGITVSTLMRKDLSLMSTWVLMRTRLPMSN